MTLSSCSPGVPNAAGQTAAAAAGRSDGPAAALGRSGVAKPREVIREALRGSDADGIMLAAH